MASKFKTKNDIPLMFLFFIYLLVFRKVKTLLQERLTNHEDLPTLDTLILRSYWAPR